MELRKIFTYFIDFNLSNYFEELNVIYELFKDNRIITYYDFEDNFYITFRFTDNINTYTIIHHFTHKRRELPVETGNESKRDSAQID